MFVKRNSLLQTIVVCAIVQVALGQAERSCQWLSEGVCEPNRAILHSYGQQYSCAQRNNNLSNCNDANTTSAVVAQGALGSCLAADSDAYQIYQCMTYDVKECQSNSQFCELSSDSTCALNAAAESVFSNGDIIYSSVDHKMDQIAFCDDYANTFEACYKLSTQDECLVGDKCSWYENVHMIGGGSSGCLPSVVPIELMPYRYDNEELISSMSKCSGIDEEASCYNEIYALNTNVEDPNTENTVDSNNADEEGLMNPAVMVALCIAVGSVLAMVGGILFVVYVHRNMMKYQELMRKLGIDPTDISLTDFSPLLDGEDEETSKMLLHTKSESSNSKDDDFC